MIQVYHKEAGGELLVDVNGHGSVKNIAGEDVMCAAVTTLTNTLGVGMLTMYRGGLLDEEPIIIVGEEGEGMARIVVKPKPHAYAVVKTAVTAVLIGYQMLAAYHPESVEYTQD